MIRTTPYRRESSRRVPVLLAGLTSSLVTSILTGAAQAAPTVNAPASAKADLFVARTLAAKPASGWSSVILKTAGTLTPAQETSLRALGVDITRRLPIIQSVAVRVPARSLGRVAALPFVTHLSLDGMVQKSDEFTVGSSEAGLAMGAGKKNKPYLLTGQGVTVAVVDSGVTPVADLSSQSGDLSNKAASRVLASVNFANALSGGATPGSSKGKNKGGDDAEGDTDINLLAGSAPSSNSYDPCGHGTHVAGIIAGNGSRSPAPYCFHTFSGIAPQANLVNVRVLDQTGQADVSTVIAGLQWVVGHQYDNKKAPIRVVNLSLGHPVIESYTTDPLCQAVEAVYRAGIVVVCAAGNQGRFGAMNVSGASNEGWGTDYGSIQSPGNDPYVITVGAAKRVFNPDGSVDVNRTDDKIATYSSRGPSRVDLILKPDIIAPGNKIISLDAQGSALDAYNNGSNQIPYASYVGSQALTSLGIMGSSGDYFQLSGTSMASPVVAGAAALMLQASPSLTPDAVKARLMVSADKWAAPDGTGDALTYGAGYLDIPAALASAVTPTLPALSPALLLNGDGTLSLVLNQPSWGGGLWGTGLTDLRATWGSSVGADRATWGSTTNSDGSVSLFMDRATWGSTAAAADRATWGSSLTDADRATWGSAPDGG